MTTSERWEKVKELFNIALEMNGPEREAVLAAECLGDDELRAEVESLLTAHAWPNPLFEKPLIQLVADDMAASLLSTGSEVKAAMCLDQRYLIERELGRGGMGTVYLARREHLMGDKVVVKVLLEEHLQNSYVLRKFEQEKESLLRVEHPGIVRLLDAGQTPQGAPYLVMKYIDGPTLHREISPEGMELERAASIIHQVGEALSAAHHEKIFHRDLKPSNIMLCPSQGGEEQVKIIDFGVAKIKNSLVAPSTVERLTVGTAAYMAPEQLEGKPVSAATDIYAMGVIAYQMVTGRKPFATAETEYQLLELQRAGVKLRPRDLRPALPQPAEDAILKALSFKPEDRYRNSADFGQDFWRAINSEAQREVGPAPAGKPRKKLFAVLLAFVLLAVALGLAFMFRKTRPSVQEQTRAAPERALSYWVEVLKYRGGKPSGKPFRLAGEINFEKDYRVRLHLNSKQPGHFYMINETPRTSTSVPAYRLLFPDPTMNNGSSTITPDREFWIPQQNWFAFDATEGIEKLWLIYSAESVPELESVKDAVNSKDQGVIADRVSALAVQNLINGHDWSKVSVLKDDERQETSVRSADDVLVHLIRLEHH